jgi:hypothetical protein
MSMLAQYRYQIDVCATVMSMLAHYRYQIDVCATVMSMLTEYRCPKDVYVKTNAVQLVYVRRRYLCQHTSIRVITKLPNSEQSYKGKVKTHKYINRQNQSTTGKL